MRTNRNQERSTDMVSSVSRVEENPVIGKSTLAIIRGYDSEPEDATENDYGDDIRDEETPTVREINIKPLDSGYLVKVGCQSVAVETTETLLKALADYLNNPDSFERAWYKNKNRNKL